LIPFISTGDLSAVVGQDVAGDDLAQIAIDSSCEMIRSYLGQRLNYLADEEVMMGGSGGMALVLPEMPIVSITSITVDGTEETDFVYVKKAGLVYRGDSQTWPRGVANIAVTYSHGYAVQESDVELDPTDDTPLPDRMPSDIRRVALALAQRIFVSAGTVLGAKSSETISPDSYSYTISESASQAAAQAVIQRDEMLVLDFHRFAGVA
jgi:hypothetical protein